MLLFSVYFCHTQISECLCIDWNFSSGNYFNVFRILSYLRFDAQSKLVFIGDYSGQVTMLKIESSGYKPITTLKGHSGNYYVLT